MSDDFNESSETPVESSVDEQPDSQPESSEPEQHEAAPVQAEEEKPAPFHEHPRFKELIEQNRSFKEQSESYQRDMIRLQTQMEMFKQQAQPKKEEPKDQFLADLEQVNPAYAKSLKSVYENAAKTQQLEQRLQQYEAQQFQEKAIGHFNSLLSNLKVEDSMDKDLYGSAVRAEVYEREARGEKLGLKDLDSIVNKFHNTYSKAMEERSRKILASYGQAKRSDSTPTSTTGGGAVSPKMPKFSSIDSPEAIQWLASELKKNKKTL